MSSNLLEVVLSSVRAGSALDYLRDAVGRIWRTRNMNEEDENYETSFWASFLG